MYATTALDSTHFLFLCIVVRHRLLLRVFALAIDLNPNCFDQKGGDHMRKSMLAIGVGVAVLAITAFGAEQKCCCDLN